MNIIEILIGQTVNSIGRAADMCWISFGDLVEIENHRGKRKVGKFALHLECPWRITDGSKILLSSIDMFEPSSNYKENEDFKWDIQGNNLFDEKTKSMFLEDENIIVQDVKLSSYYDVTIIFSNQLIFECFVNCSSKGECWRFFQPGSDKEHLIITGQGIDFN